MPQLCLWILPLVLWIDPCVLNMLGNNLTVNYIPEPIIPFCLGYLSVAVTNNSQDTWQNQLKWVNELLRLMFSMLRVNDQWAPGMGTVKRWSIMEGSVCWRKASHVRTTVNQRARVYSNQQPHWRAHSGFHQALLLNDSFVTEAHRLQVMTYYLNHSLEAI